MDVQRGDRVRLAPKIARSLMKEHARRGRKVNWLVRRGVVIRVSAPADNVPAPTQAPPSAGPPCV